MEDVRRELDRLRRAWRATRARDLAGRTHLLVLGAAAAAALGSRLFGPWPGIGALEGRWIPALLAAGILAALGLALRRGLPFLLGISREGLARDLDDTYAWQDAVDTALSLPAAGGTRPVEVFLGAQTAGRLRGLETGRIWPRRLDGRWIRRFLLFVFLFVLLAPGVSGLFGESGAGRGDQPGIGARPDDVPEDAVDADRWLRDHVRLYLRRAEDPEHPLRLTARLYADLPLPAALDGVFEIFWDGEAHPLGSWGAEAGARADLRRDIDLPSIETLAELLTPGRHIARLRLTPGEGPYRAPLESNLLVVEIQEGGGGGGGDGEPEEPEAGQDPPPEETPPEPTPEPSPPPPEPPPTPEPEGEEEAPAPPPPEEARVEVVDPLVRDDAELVEKEDAIVAVPDPEAGLEPPPLVPLGEALPVFDRVVERAMGDERVRPADRAYLQRYFEALRRAAAAAREGAR